MDMIRRAKELASIIAAVANLTPNSGGGSGSGDLSTATVTLVDSGGVGAVLYGAFYCESEPPIALDPHTNACAYTDQGTAEIVLYKGLAMIDAGNVVDQGATFTVSGNASVTTPIPLIYVTGDCTITFTGGGDVVTN